MNCHHPTLVNAHPTPTHSPEQQVLCRCLVNRWGHEPGPCTGMKTGTPEGSTCSHQVRPGEWEAPEAGMSSQLGPSLVNEKRTPNPQGSQRPSRHPRPLPLGCLPAPFPWPWDGLGRATRSSEPPPPLTSPLKHSPQGQACPSEVHPPSHARQADPLPPPFCFLSLAPEGPPAPPRSTH